MKARENEYAHSVKGFELGGAINSYNYSLVLKIFILVLVIAWGNKGRVKRRFHISPVLWRPPMGSQPSLMLDHIVFSYSGIIL